jgi:hypothetical protein
MIGDQQDCVTRLKSLIPNGWFKDASPILDGILSGLAWGLALGFSLINYAAQQTRIKTATDGFLDLISLDFFGSALPRKTSELDPPFLSRILANLFRERPTRKGMVEALEALTGRTPIVFEPANPADTGCLGVNLALGVHGGLGSMLLPYQAFVTAFRPSGSGIPNIAGLGTSPCGLGIPAGAIVTSYSWITGNVTDADIYATIDATQVEGTIIWTKLSN